MTTGFITFADSILFRDGSVHVTRLIFTTVHATEIETLPPSTKRKVINGLFLRQSATKLVETLDLKGLFDLKRNNNGFPAPFPQGKVVPLFELPVQTTNTPAFNGREGGGVWIPLFSDGFVAD